MRVRLPNMFMSSQIRGYSSQLTSPQLDQLQMSLPLSSNDTNWQGTDQASVGQSESGDTNRTQLALETMVASPTAIPTAKTNTTAIATEPTHGSGRQPSSSRPVQENAPVSMHSIRDLLIARGVPERSSVIICQSWRAATLKSYSSAWKKWLAYCTQKGVNQLHPDLYDIIAFLTQTFDSQKSTSWTSTFRSAISTVLEVSQGTDIGKHVLISRLLKGMNNMEPKRPRYTNTWDVRQLLTFLEQNNEPTLKTITYKIVTLIALTTASRCSEIAALTTEYMNLSSDQAIFQIHKSKTWNKRLMKPIHVHSFPPNSGLCPIIALRAYLTATLTIRGANTALFITMVKPYKPASASTISRWIKSTMRLAGIDIETYKAHSTRSASTSRAVQAGVTTESILKVADWTNVQTFRSFYHREPDTSAEVTRSQASKSFTTAVLSQVPDISPSDDLQDQL